jgi:hypothetical protein
MFVEKRSKHQLVLLAIIVTLSGFIAAGFTRHNWPLFSAGAETAARPERVQPRTVVVPRFANKVFAPATPAAAPYDLVRNVLAGGGGQSTGGSFELKGTAGQAAAGTQMNGGQFSLTGGFWQPEVDATPTPTPTPTPAPTATPTPAPTATPTPAPTATPTPSSSPTPTPSPTATPTPSPSPGVPNVVQFDSSNYSVQEDCTTVSITVNRVGDTSAPATVDYFTADVSASSRKDYITALGTLRFAAGETSKTLAVLINEDSYLEGNETFSVNLTNPSGASLGGPSIATVTIIDDGNEPATNVIDDPETYVCQHYHDFLGRQPDPAGLQFWTNQITACGTDQACVEGRRINVSASFFLSIEFQDTGYLVERIYKAAYGDATSTSTFPSAHQLPVPAVRLNEFRADTQEIGQGVVVGQGNWRDRLETNKQAFTAEFVTRSRFSTAYPSSITAAQFVDQLNANAGSPLSPAERDQLVNDLASGARSRAQVLRAVAEDPDLSAAESNRAFVLMQYFGYLQRNPNDPQDSDHTGYDFWLTKLNQFNGNYINAEMVKAFITSIEYRQRFGP